MGAKITTPAELLPGATDLLNNPAVEIQCRLVEKIFDSLPATPIELADVGMTISVFGDYHRSPFGLPMYDDESMCVCEIYTAVVRNIEKGDNGITTLWCSSDPDAPDRHFYIIGRGLDVEHPIGGPVFKVKINVSRPMQIILTKPEWKRITMTKTQELLITEHFNRLIDAIQNGKPLSDVEKAYIIEWLEEQREIELHTAEMVADRSN